MKIRNSSEMVDTSSASANSHFTSDADSFHKSKQINKKHSFEDNSSLLLMSADSTLRKSKKKSKKKSKVVSSNWIISPINDGSAESDSSDSDYDESYLLEDVSAIYASDSSNCSNEDECKDVTKETFEELMEEADRDSDTDSNECDDTFYLKMKSELTKEFKKEPPKKKRKIIEKPDVRIHPIYSKNSEVLLMNHPASVTIYRYVSVEVLSGSVSVYGHELNSQSPSLKAFSSNTSGLIELKTESCDAFWKKKEGFKHVSQELQRVTGSIKMARKILQESSNSSVVVILEGCVFPPHLQFLELYYPLILKFKMTEKFQQKFKSIKHHRKTYCIPCCDATIQFNTEAEDLASDVLATIRNSQLRESEGPRILVFGPKNTGKSSLLRYLMNKTLSLFSSVYFLDADPGQTEFTPPGVVSITHVTKPVIGPPFSHQRKPLAMSFTGAISADSSPDMYSKSVSRMVHVFRSRGSGDALFVNTMGWIKGIGLECLKNVLKDVMPTILIEITTEEDDSMFDYREYLTDRTQFYQIKRPFSGAPKDLGAADKRSLSLLSYFGKCQLPHEKPKHLNSFKPMCVCWDKIPFYVFGKKVPPYRLVESMSGSFVALCNVDKSLMLESNNKALPKTLEEEPENDCMGFGIVRAVDESKHLLYIVTPLSLEDLKSVNAIIKGNIMVPPSVFLEQPILGVPLPFTDETGIISPETETENQDNITKQYRKSISKRYGVHKQRK